MSKRWNSTTSLALLWIDNLIVEFLVSEFFELLVLGVAK
ncbi:hypothetical protein LYNGBM3L_70990 [Moorena producens 3L]|uniref:Uncharacterized protein n=1 Tax=Moorena producens 3L TaxID=489825 RepID=F4Y3G2_9CYAN|nr:hypothetical protein [Moorena producens 3L]EGJ28638.1 hypothetical protein LYNGBM3L_70990 [Moorena producens 3L]